MNARILSRFPIDHKAVADHLHRLGVYLFAQLVARLAGLAVGRVALHLHLDQLARLQRVPSIA